MLPTLLLVLLWGSEWATNAWGFTKDHTDLQTRDQEYTLTVPEVVTVPEHLCVLVPCFFSYPKKDWDEDTPAWGYWFRDGANINKGYPAATNKQPSKVNRWPWGRFQLVGDPRDYNCSLLITDAWRSDSAWYYFRVERGTHVRYSFEKNKFYLNVTALPQKPAVYVPESLEPGQQVTAICVFDWDFEQCQAPTFSWTGAAVSSQETPVTTAHVSVLTFTPRPQDHDTSLICRVNFAGGRVSVANSVQLYVSCAPEVPVISISRANGSALEQQGDSPHLEVKKGQFLQLLCEAESRPPATLRWTLQDQVLTSTRLSGSGSLELVLPQVKPEDAGRYTCHVENRLGFQTRTLNLSVQYAPENLTVTVSRANGTVLQNLRNGSSLSVLKGQSLCLLCETHSNPPASLSWSFAGKTLRSSPPSGPVVLELPGIQMEHEGEFVCQAQNALGSLQGWLSLFVHYPPQLLGPSCFWEDEGLNCSCSSRAQPGPSLRWRLGGTLLEGSPGNTSYTVTSSSAGPWANSSLSLRPELSTGLQPSCETENVHGHQSASVLLLPEKEGPISRAFSKGAVLGTGITVLILSFILVTVKILSWQQTQVETPAQGERGRVTRRSTILDYINVTPKAGHLGQNRRAKHNNPSRIPPADANSRGPKSSLLVPGSENNQEEVHYAALHFSGRKAQETQESRNIDSEYAEIRFH